MSDDRLVVQRQPEYIVIDRQKPKRRIILITLAIVAVAFIFVLIALPSKPPVVAKPLTDLDLQSIGLHASVRTKWIDGSEQYIFTVKPLTGLESRFGEVLTKNDLSQIRFNLHFQDADGFKICSVTARTHKDLGTSGNPVAISSEGTVPSCSQDQFEKVTKWTLSSNYPAVNMSLSGEGATKVDGLSKLSQLTGSDFQTGRIETLDQGSYQVTRHAEYMTLLEWQPSDALDLSCNASVCVITNKNKGDSVHASKQ